MEFQSDKVEAFKSIFKENQSKIIAQEGCYDVQLLQDIHESNIFYLQQVEIASAFRPISKDRFFSRSLGANKSTFLQ